MPGIDLLVSADLSLEIKNNLDHNVLKKLERELFFDHGMSIKLSIEHFINFHDILKKNSDLDIAKFEKDCIEKIIQVSKSNNNYTVKIISKKLSEKIFNFFGDPESRAILLCMMNKGQTVTEIQKNSGILKSPTYRKIENLLLDGLILESGKILKNNKRVSQYRCIFDEVHAVIGEKKLKLEVILSAKRFNESSIAKLGLFDP
jgi:hypothetical protein